MMTDIVERANKAEIRPEEQSKKAESGRENFWNGIVERDIKTEIDTITIKKKGMGKLCWFMLDIKRNIPIT